MDTILIDRLAQEIRRVDGSHSLGAAALAEALMPFVAALQAAPEGGEWVLVPRVADGYTRHMMKHIESEADARIVWTAIIAHCERLASPTHPAAAQKEPTK